VLQGRRILGVLMASALLALAACTGTILSGSRSDLVLKIGVDLPLSGVEGRIANPALNGIRFYVAQHPALDGFSIQVDARDDSVAGTPSQERGASNIEALIADPQVVAVIGPLDGNVARAEIPVANLASLALLSPATASPCLTKAFYLPAGLSRARTPVACKDVGLPAAADLRPTGVNNYFRLATTDDLEGPAAADYAFRSLQIVRAATISDHEAYGQALARSFAARFVKLGGSVLGQLDVDTSTGADATAFLKRMRRDGVQAVYFGGSTGNRGCVIRSQMGGIFPAGDAAPFLGGDGIAEDPACVQQAGTEASGIVATVPAVDPDFRAGAAGLIAAFKAAHPSPSDYGPYTAVAYDAAAILYAALDRAIKAAGGRLPARAAVVSQLAATQGFIGVTGTIGFDQAGDTTNRTLSIYESPGSDPQAAWTLVGEIDYSGTLPY
jgi:branched-chain amino acid transport system substrate-binding protein